MELITKKAGVRLDKVPTDLTELSRSQTNDEIKKGTVLINGKAVKAKHVVRIDDVVIYGALGEEVLEYTTENISLDIIYEDDDVAVVNKSQGMVARPSAGYTSGALVNVLTYHIEGLPSINDVTRPEIIHCIGKDTSGLLMAAKNDKTHNALVAEPKDKKSFRRYVVIIHGSIPNDRGVVEAPIERSEKDRKKQAVIAEGKPAVTHFKVLERLGSYTSVESTLETGRMHQICVYTAYIGYPATGDPLYRPRKTLKGDGQFSHARTLGFTHLTADETSTFTAEAPAIFKETSKNLRNDKA